MNSNVLVVVAFPIVMGLLLFLVDPDDISGPSLRAIFRPGIGASFAFMLYAVPWLLISRGRRLVAGDDWIAEYRLLSLRPTKRRVAVHKSKGMKLRVEGPCTRYQGKQYKDWADLVVTKSNGHEIIRMPVNTKLLKDDYQERFEEWKNS